MAPYNEHVWEEWMSLSGVQQHRDRFPLLRPVRYEVSEPTSLEGLMSPWQGGAITVNVGNGGLCLLMDWAPRIQEVMLIHVPMPDNVAKTPTLVEVRWVRPLPFERGIYFVGLKFVF